MTKDQGQQMKYAKADVSSVASRSWLQTPIISANLATSKGRRLKNSTIITNPIFQKCAELTQDDLWNKIFISAAGGKFPRGFGYQDGTLFFRRRTKTLSVTVPENSIEAFEVCKNFFRDMGGIASQEEQDKNYNDDLSEMSGRSSKELRIDRLESEIPNTSSSDIDIGKEEEQLQWSKIFPKKNNSLYLYVFADLFGRRHHLTIKEKDDLKRTLNLANALSLINDEIVVFQGQNIIDLIGLTFDPKSRKLNFEPLSRPYEPRKQNSSRSKSNSPQGLFIKLWDKYLVSLGKKVGNDKDPGTSVPSSIPTSMPPGTMVPGTYTTRKIIIRKVNKT